MTTSLKCEVKALLKLLDVPGALVLLKSDVYDSFLIEYGYSDLNNKTDVILDDKFRIGSNTKMFTGIVLLQLYQEGLVDLDAPVSDYLLGLPDDYKNLTVREVGNMRSGIPDYFNDPRFQKVFQEEHYRNWLPAEMYGIGITGEQSFLPGAQYEYSNTNAIILGLIIERLTEHTIQDEIKKRVIEPLHLCLTEFKLTGEFNKPRMNGYEYDSNNKLKNVTHYNPSWAWAAGAITSDLKDMSKFIKYGIGKHVLLDKNATIQQRKFLPVKPSYFHIKTSYGFQLIKLEKFIGHNGSISGYNSYILYEIKTNTTLIVAINLQFTKEHISPANFITEYIVASLNNKTTFKEAKSKI